MHVHEGYTWGTGIESIQHFGLGLHWAGSVLDHVCVSAEEGGWDGMCGTQDQLIRASLTPRHHDWFRDVHVYLRQQLWLDPLRRKCSLSTGIIKQVGCKCGAAEGPWGRSRWGREWQG